MNEWLFGFFAFSGMVAWFVVGVLALFAAMDAVLNWGDR